MKLHKSITPDRVVALVEEYSQTLSNPGICIACGARADGVDPDARGDETALPCDACGEPCVYGAEELLFYV